MHISHHGLAWALTPVFSSNASSTACSATATQHSPLIMPNSRLLQGIHTVRAICLECSSFCYLDRWYTSLLVRCQFKCQLLRPFLTIQSKVPTQEMALHSLNSLLGIYYWLFSSLFVYWFLCSFLEIKV